MAKLILKRTSEWVNSMRHISIYLNEKKIDSIANGETKTFEVEPGKHILRAKLDWCTSKPLVFDLPEGNTLEIELSGFKYGRWLMPVALLLPAGFIAIRSIQPIPPVYYSLSLVPVFGYLLYFISWGRNKYLRLRAV